MNKKIETKDHSFIVISGEELFRDDKDIPDCLTLLKDEDLEGVDQKYFVDQLMRDRGED